MPFLGICYNQLNLPLPTKEEREPGIVYKTIPYTGTIFSSLSELHLGT